MAFEEFQKKDSVVIVYTGDGKGKTSASLGLLMRGLGAGFRVAFVQFVKTWEVSEHRFLQQIAPVYQQKFEFYKGGLGFFNAGELSSGATVEEHMAEAQKTFEFTYLAATSGEYDLVICDEINNAVNDGLLPVDDLKKLIIAKHPTTNLCLTGRNFPEELIDLADIVTEMKKVKHHYDDKFLANLGVDF